MINDMLVWKAPRSRLFNMTMAQIVKLIADQSRLISNRSSKSSVLVMSTLIEPTLFGRAMMLYSRWFNLEHKRWIFDPLRFLSGSSISASPPNHAKDQALSNCLLSTSADRQAIFMTVASLVLLIRASHEVSSPLSNMLLLWCERQVYFKLPAS